MVPRRSSHPKEILKTVIKTFTHYPIWDISWLVAFIFTWGSVVWVLNVCLVFTTKRNWPCKNKAEYASNSNAINRLSLCGFPW
jgi:hypothetical protein